MKHDAARQIGEELKGTLARLKTLAKDERAVQGPDVEALETAVINYRVVGHYVGMARLRGYINTIKPI